MTNFEPRVSIETPRGTPAEGGALEWVMASVTPVEGLVAAEVRIDGATAPAKLRWLADQVAVSAWCDTRGLPPGLHEIHVTARWEEGGRATDTRLLLSGLGERAELTAAPAAASTSVGVVRV